MRVRVTIRTFHALWIMRRLLNPVLYPKTAFQIFSHKMLRYAVGLFQILALTASVFLFAHGTVYQAAFAGQLALIGLALIGATRVGASLVPLSRYATYVMIVNSAAIYAFCRFVRGDRRVLWSPRKG